MIVWPRKQELSIPDKGINVIEKMTLGGVEQTILVQGYSAHNPILLFLHGGPSMPLPGVSCRGVDYALITCTKQLVQHCTLVYWDQRGTGKSYSKAINPESMRIDSYVRDAAELSDYLRKRFDKKKIYVVGHSWGTVIGLKLISRYPEKFHGYAAFSQIVSWVENDRLCYRMLMDLAKRTNNKKMYNELAKVGEPPHIEGMKQWRVLRTWLMRNKSMFHDAGDGQSPTTVMIMGLMMRSADYSFMDIYNSFVRGFRLAYGEKMLQDIQSFDFATEVPKAEVPVLFVHGRMERHVMAEPARCYYEALDAPQGKQFVWAEKSSHVFHIEDARLNEQALLEWIGRTGDH